MENVSEEREACGDLLEVLRGRAPLGLMEGSGGQGMAFDYVFACPAQSAFRRWLFSHSSPDSALPPPRLAH